MELEPLIQAFQQTHQRRFGYAPPSGGSAPPLVLERLSIEQIRPGAALAELVTIPQPSSPARRDVPQAPAIQQQASVEVSVHLGGAWRSLPLWQRCQLAPNDRLYGPALIVEPTGTNLLPLAWQARVLEDGKIGRAHV